MKTPITSAVSTTLMAAICLLCGCAPFDNHYVITATGTSIGLEISQNPATQLYQAKLGYHRAELALIPTSKDKTTGSIEAVPDVVMEMHYANIFSLSSSGIYQRLAVGKSAVTQPGASLLFSKNSDGSLDPNVAAAVLKSVNTLSTPDPVTTAIKVPLADAYKRAVDKTAYDKIAKSSGYESFRDFLTEANSPADKISAISRGISALSSLNPQ